MSRLFIPQHARHTSHQVLLFLAYIYKAYPVDAYHPGRAPFNSPDHCLKACGPNERQNLAARALDTISTDRRTPDLKI